MCYTKAVLVLFLSSLSFISKGMEEEKKDFDYGNIKINNEKGTLLAHVNRATFLNSEHLKNVDFIEHREGSFVIVSKGNPSQLSPCNISSIANNNFVYVSMYTREHRSTSEYENVAAVILGTTDQREGLQLCSAMLSQIKKSLPRQKDQDLSEEEKETEEGEDTSFWWCVLS